MNSDLVSLKKVLSFFMSEDKTSKYIQKPDINTSDPGEIYQSAVSYLLSGQTEKAIIHIVYGLDIDRNNMQLLHLCKSMLINTCEYLYDNSEAWKHPDLIKEKNDLEKKLDSLKNNLKTMKRKLEKANNKFDSLKPKFFSLKKLFIFYLIKRKKLIKEINSLKSSINNHLEEIEILEKSLENIVPMVKIDEYSRILSLIIEVCTLPTRFEWVLTKK